MTVPAQIRTGTHSTRNLAGTNAVWTYSTFTYALFTCLSWLIQCFTGFRDPQLFTITTYLSFIGFGCVLFALSIRYESTIHPILFGMTLALSALGSASFAFHTDGTIYTPRHTLDIALAWVAYAYIASVSAYTMLVGFFPQSTATALLAAAAAMYAICTLVIFVWYDVIYANQLNFFVCAGTVVYLTTFISRVRALRCNYSITLSTLLAVWDCATLLVMQALYVMLGGVVWRQAISIERYNYEHGYWHTGNGLIFCVLGLYMLQSLHAPCVERFLREDLITQIALWTFQALLFAMGYADVTMTVYCWTVGSATFALLCVTGECLRRVLVSMKQSTCRQCTNQRENSRHHI